MSNLDHHSTSRDTSLSSSSSSSSQRSDDNDPTSAPRATTTAQHTNHFSYAPGEYEAQLKQILELDSSSDEERYQTLIRSARNVSTPPPPFSIQDLDLDIDFALLSGHPNTTTTTSRQTTSVLTSSIVTTSSSSLSSFSPSSSSTTASQGHSNPSLFSNPTLTTATAASTTITIREPDSQVVVIQGEAPAAPVVSRGKTLSPSPPSQHLSPIGLLSPSLTATSSTSSVESASRRTIARAASVVSTSSERRQRNSLYSIPSPPGEGHFLHQANPLLHRPGQHSNGGNIPPFQFSSASSRSTQSKRTSQLSVKMNGQRNTSTTRTGSRNADGVDENTRDNTTIPIILRGAHSRLVNGLQTITSLEQQFNELRIPELELINTPETTIKAVLADIYKITDELHMHLQGGPLADNTLGSSVRNETNGIVISDGNQRQKRIKDLLDRIARETSLYEEFVRQSSYLSLDAILNESSDPDEDDEQENDELLLRAAGLDRDTSELDSTSDLRYEDTLSQASFMSNHNNNNNGYSHHHPHLQLPTSIASSPVAHSYRSGSAGPRRHLHLHPHRYVSPGSVASSSFTGRHSRASSASFSFSELNRSDSNAASPGVGMTGGSGSSPGGSGAEPWETFRWTPLAKLSDHLYSEEVKASLGLGTCLAVSNVMAIGTSRGTVLVYDGNQSLVGAYGTAQYAVEHGSVCSVAISSDHRYVAAGHSLGSIIVWNLTKPPSAGPSRVIPPVNKETALAGRKAGHLRGSAVLHVHFVGIKHNEIASADDQGMAFHHLLYKVVMVHAVETTRLLGKYPPPRYPKHYEDPHNATSSKRSTIFGMGVLPYGQVPHPADHAGLVALLTPFKMLIVCLKPKAQTLFKFVKPKEVLAKEGDATATVASGSLAWLPAMKAQQQPHQQQQQQQQQQRTPSGSSETEQDTPPMLACSWNRHLYLFQVVKSTGATGSVAAVNSPSSRPSSQASSQQQHTETTARPDSSSQSHNSRHAKLDFVKTGDWMCRDNIVGVQWVKPQILLLLTNAEEVIVFDPRLMCETERCSMRSLQVVYHDWFKDAFKALQSSAVASAVASAGGPVTAAAIADAKGQVADMSYNNSWRVYKSKLFVLGVHRLQVGTILNWTDRILALVKSGDFLEGIALATLFYTGKSIQSAVVGLPEDEATRHRLVGEKIYELLTASLNYSFNPERMQDVDLADGLVVDNGGGGVGAGTVLFHDLAIQCIESCLAMDDQAFLFDEVYERYAEAPNRTVKGIFLESLEPYILRDKITEMPPQVMQAFVRHYSEKGQYQVLEQCICHTPCHVLEMDQIVDLCQRHRLYTALIYVWNKSIGDYVSPVVELLKVIKKILKDRKKASSNGTPADMNISLSPQNGAVVVPRQHHARSTPSGDSTVAAEQCMSDEEAVQKLYKYLADTLLGRSFTDGAQLDELEAVAAKESLYSFIFSGHCVMWPKTGGQLIITGDHEDEIEPTYPYLRLFLRHDCNEFLKVLDGAFEDSYLNQGNVAGMSGVVIHGHEGFGMANGTSSNHVRRTTATTTTSEEGGPSKVVSKQLIINTLLEVFTPSTPFGSVSSSMSGSQNKGSTSSPSTTVDAPSSTSPNGRSGSESESESSRSSHLSRGIYATPPQDNFSAQDFAHLYSFVARNYARSSKTIVLSPTTLHRILTRLASDTDPVSREERQVAAQALLRHYTPGGDEEAMMALYERAGFYRVLEKMYRAQKQYGPWVLTFLRDPARRSKVFAAIQKLLGPAARSYASTSTSTSSPTLYQSRRASPPITEKQRTDVVKTVMDHIAEVVDIDGEQAALLVHKYLNAEHQVVLRTLHGSKPRLFAYLRGLLEPSSLMERRAAAEEAARARRAKLAALEAHHGPLLHSLDRFEADIELDDELELYGPGDLGVEDDDDPLTMIGAQAITDPEMHEIYIELMCEYDPTSVYDYLERHQDNCYRLEKVLSICERAGVVDAVVWILERSGNVNGALTKVLEIVQDRIQAVADLVASKPKDRLQDAQWSMEEQNTIRASLVRLRGVLNVGKQLCERSSRRARGLRKHSTTIATTTTNSAAGTPTLSPPGSSPTNSGTARETETLWFRLLQTFVAASRKMTLLVEGDKDDDEDMEAAAEANHADEAPAADTDKTDSQAVVTARKEGAQKRVRGAKTAPSGPERSSGAAALSMIENAPQALFANTGVESQTSYNVVNQVVNSFKGYVHSILTTLLLSASTPQVSLPSLLRRLIQAQEDAATAASSAEDGHGDEASVARDARFADFREIILGMLDTYKYEGQLLEMTNNLFERDLLVGVRQIVKFHAKGWRPRKRNCEICGGAFWGPDVIRDLWVQQQRAAAAGIQAALATKVTSDSPDPSVSASASSYSTTASTGAIVVVPSESGESSLSNASPSPAQPSTVTPSSAQEMSAAEKLAGKDLILFRCGHGYHRQCLEMETRVVGGVNTVAAAVGRLSGTQPSKDDPRGKTPIRNTDAQVSSTVGQQPSPLEQQPEEQALLCIMCSGLSKGPRVAPGGGSSSLKGHSSKRHSNSHQRRARRRDLHSEWEFIPHP